MTSNSDSTHSKVSPGPTQMTLAELKMNAAYQVGVRLGVLGDYLRSGVPVLDAKQRKELQRACLLLRPELRSDPAQDNMAQLAGMVDNVREACQRRVLRWDVRNVASLVDLFPGLVPKSCRERAVRAHVADDPVEDGPWMLEFDPDTPRPNTLADGQVLPETQALARLVSCASNPSHLAQLMPQVHAAQARFNEDLPKAQGKDVLATINTFARVLNAAIKAFYLDTADYNSWESVKMAAQAKSPDTLPFSYFSTFCPTKATAARLQEVADDILRERAASAGHDLAEANGSDDSEASAATVRQRCG